MARLAFTNPHVPSCPLHLPSLMPPSCPNPWQPPFEKSREKESTYNSRIHFQAMGWQELFSPSHMSQLVSTTIPKKDKKGKLLSLLPFSKKSESFTKKTTTIKKKKEISLLTSLLHYLQKICRHPGDIYDAD